MLNFFKHWFRKPNADLVPFYDFSTGETTMIPRAELSPGVVLVQMDGRPEPVYVEASQLNPGPYQHPPFEGEMRRHIEQLTEDLTGVIPRSYEEWEDGFRRDQNPDQEVAGWIHLANILKAMSERHAYTQEEKMEGFKILVACFTGPEDSVRARSDPRLLPPEQVETMTRYFYHGGYGVDT